MLKKIIKWLPAAFIAACSYYFSSKSQLQYMPTFWSADKVVHFFCYAGFAFWVAFACNIRAKRQVWIPISIISLWGITDEIHQMFVPYRSASVFDWLADTLGASLGSAVYVFLGVKIFDWIFSHLSKKENGIE